MGPIDAFFAGNEVVNGVKNTKKSVAEQLKSGTNKYDNILNNKIQKTKVNGGELNAVNVNPLFRSASEELDFICKVAEEAYNRKREDRPNRNFVRRDRNYQQTERPNRDFVRRDRNYQQIERPKLDLREIRNDSEKREYNPYAIAGGAVLGAGLLHAAVTKDPTAPLRSIKEGTKKFVHKIPRKTLGKNPAVRTGMDMLNTGTKPVRKKLEREAQNANKAGKKKQYFVDDTELRGDDIRMASDVLDEIFEKMANVQSAAEEAVTEAIKEVPSRKDKIKRMFRDDFIRSGIEAVPYYAAPAALGYVAGKNISNPAEDPGVTRVVVDVPLESLQNKFSKKAEDLSWAEWGKNRLPSRAVQGLGRTIFPALVIGITGKNIKGRMENIQEVKEKNAPKKGNARIILETNENWDEKKASDILAEWMLEKAATDASIDAEKTLQSFNTESAEQKKKRAEKTLANYNDLPSQGIRKKKPFLD